MFALANWLIWFIKLGLEIVVQPVIIDCLSFHKLTANSIDNTLHTHTRTLSYTAFS